ncbi:plasmid pRiA4b ORF-3 family protein [Robertkochia aurantiaca]|uniref:plasmid pRiA4b ORF-3 family protein n=1 Tax=Robertkochia aurantiaca TaxID=2873700 RepID=UPI001CCBA863|nr:plasmid pRiA4b ORF-3 family protein [Robertkochia sp. 3YJGBD-33]
MIYKFRVILDAEEDVFRDIEIEGNNSLEDLHNSISQAFGFDGTEMASFYMSNENWEQGEEIALFDMSEGGNEVRLMSETPIEELLDEDNRNLIYVYDFLSMWTFFVELADIAEKEDGAAYPNLMFAHGQLPDSPPEKNFEIENLAEGGEDEENISFDIDDYDEFDFDENWN